MSDLVFWNSCKRIVSQWKTHRILADAAVPVATVRKEFVCCPTVGKDSTTRLSRGRRDPTTCLHAYFIMFFSAHELTDIRPILFIIGFISIYITNAILKEAQIGLVTYQ
jgi:hypothetical protein